MTLLLHVLMLFLLSGGSAKVVQNFEQECGQFFAGGKSPTTFTGSQQICQNLHGDDYATYCDAGGKSPTTFSGSQYKQICQTLYGDVHYATYYDTKNRIPVYSAYKFEGRKSCKRPSKWYIEPQLDVDNPSLPHMCFENQNIQGLGDHQALNGDYKDSGYHKGHLVPVYHRQPWECVKATFTLTNAAPQNSSFNQGQWSQLEQNISKNLSEQCLPMYSVYIVTGVVPGPKKPLNNRVKVPSHFWTAYCCLDQNNRCQISRGFIGVNENITPENITVNDLNERLAELYKVTSFKVFDIALLNHEQRTENIENSE